MYYSDSYDPYHNIELKYYQKENLPMDEFAKGNFSQAHKIIDTYRNHVKNCIASITRQNTGGEENISDYLKKQLADLEAQHKERTEKRNQALQDIKNIQKEIDKEWKAFQDEGEGDKYRNIFLDFLKKNGYNTNLFKSAFENSKGGKALSLKLKKVEGNLLPDINERIEEMKKMVKGDIV